jgi:hypothetical protein
LNELFHAEVNSALMKLSLDFLFNFQRTLRNVKK